MFAGKYETLLLCSFQNFAKLM